MNKTNEKKITKNKYETIENPASIVFAKFSKSNELWQPKTLAKKNNQTDSHE